MEPPLTGREVERSLTAALVERLARGRPGAVVFVGEAGVGKSRLLREARPAGAVTTIELVGYEPEASVALGAVRPLLTRFAATEAANQSDDRARLAEVVFTALAEAGPVLLAVDDLQWLDTPSTALLHYLLRGAVAARRPIGLLAAARPSAQTSEVVAALERLFGEDPGAAGVAQDLAPLAEAEAIALVQAAAPGTSAVDARAVWRRVGGSPYWLLALARSRGDDPTVLLSTRLRRLSPDAATLLSLVSVAGRPLTPSFAAEALDWHVDRVRAGSRELGSAGLGVERPEGLQPAHDLVREAVSATLSTTAARAHHERVASTLEASAGGRLEALMAALTHRKAAGLPVVDAALAVAEPEHRRRLDRAAIVDLGRIADEAPVDEPNRDRLALAVARLASEVGAADVAFERWRDIAERGGASAREAALAGAREAFRIRKADDVERLLAGPTAPDWDDIEAVEVGALLASSKLWVELDHRAGAELARGVLERARRLPAATGKDGQRAVRARFAALEVGADAALQGGEWQRLRGLGAELVEASRELDDRAQIEALIYDRLAFRLTSDHAAAAERAERALRLARRAFIPDLIVESGHFLALSLADLGRLDEAETAAREAAQLAARIADYPKLRTYPSTFLHQLDVVRGGWRDGLDAIEGDAIAQPNPHYRLTHRWISALVISAIEGERAAERVARLVAQSIEDARTARCPRCLAEALATTAISLARVGRPDQALGHLAEGAELADGRLPEPATAGSRAWATALTLSGEDRARALAEAVPVVRHARGAIDGLWVRVDAGRAFRAVDQGEAARVLRETGEEAEAIGARTIAQLADQLLRSLGQRTWRRTAVVDAPLALTEREAEVARLIATGASNQEIAGALFVSVKTVERHVSNALAKLGARNRTELAERVRER